MYVLLIATVNTKSTAWALESLRAEANQGMKVRLVCNKYKGIMIQITVFFSATTLYPRGYKLLLYVFVRVGIVIYRIEFSNKSNLQRFPERRDHCIQHNCKLRYS